MNGFASPPTEVCRIVNRQKTRRVTVYKPQDTDFTVQSRNKAYKNIAIYNDIYEILGDISTSVPTSSFRGTVPRCPPPPPKSPPVFWLLTMHSSVICQKCTVADDVQSRTEDCTFSVVVWRWVGDRDCILHSITVVCPRLLPVGAFTFFVLFNFVRSPAMSLTRQCHLNQYIVPYLLTYLLTS